MIRIICLEILIIGFFTQSTLFSQVATNALSRIIRQIQPSDAWQAAGEMAMNARFPLIEKVEIRSELDRLLFSRQEYMTRATLNGFQQGKAEKNKMRAFVEWKSEVRQGEWRDTYYKMYSSLLDWQYAVLVLQSLYEEKALLEKADSLYVYYLESGRDVDLVGYAALKQELLDLNSDIYIARVKWQAAAGVVGADTTELKTDPWWLLPDQMVALIDTIQVKESGLDKAELAYLDASSSVLRAETARWLDFVQARYTVRDDLLLQNRFSIGLGLVIPWKGSTIIKGKELAFRKQQLTEESRLEKTLRESSFTTVREAFFVSYRAYQQHIRLLSDSTFYSLKQKLQKSGKVDPIKWLLLERNVIKRKETMYKELKSLWENYIEALHLSGQMYMNPYVNYLYGLNMALFPGE